MNHSPLFTDKELSEINTSSMWSKISENDISQKIEIVRKWQDSALTLKLTNSKEIQLQGYFINIFFGDILGYKNLIQEKDFWNIEIEQVTLEDNTRPDGILGFFNMNNGTKEVDDVRVIIELKAFDYDLDKQQSRLIKITPVEQAFQYAQKSGKNCNWVILSNFKEIRLYRYPDKSKYELFNIFKLHEINEFKKFLYLLYCERLFYKDLNIIPKTEKLYTGRLDTLKDITNKFYNEYKEYRELLFNHLWQNNKNINKLQLLVYTQKIIDRLLFIRFAGDTFMEFNVLFKVRNAFDDLFSLRDNLFWQTINDLFDSFDKGFKGKIPEFNGELFKKDEVYNTLNISDFIIKDLVRFFLKYDFKNNLKVEILGHIFEQSITDLQELKIKHLQEIGANFNYSETISKRKSEGVFYTPEYITEYMVSESVGKWLSDRDYEIFAELKIDDITTIDIDLERWKKTNTKITRNDVVNIHLQYIEKYKKVLSEIKIIDISCGSGALLTKCFDYLSNEWERILKSYYEIKGLNSILKKKVAVIDFEHSAYETELWQVKKNIIINNLYGVDLNPESVDITKLSLWLKTANKSIKLADLKDNIKVGNSLIESKKFKNHFIWKEKFPEIMINGGFDVIVGNPPYVNVENLDEKERNYLFEKYQNCKGRTDIYIAFIEKTLSLIKNTSYVSFIIPYAFTNQNYANDLRKYLIENNQIVTLTDLHNFSVFEQASVKNIIINFKKNNENKNTTIRIANSSEDIINKSFYQFEINQNIYLKFKEYRFETKPIFHFLDLKTKIEDISVTFDKIFFVAYGARLNQKDGNEGKDIYIYDKKAKGLKPFLEGKNIERYYYSQDGWLDYKPKEHYNSMFKELFENEKIMLINVVKDICRFAYDDKGLYNSHTVINCVRYDKLDKAEHITPKNAIKEIDLGYSQLFEYKSVLAILNSKLLNWYFYNFLSEGIHFYPNDVKSLPITKNIANNPILNILADEIIKYTNEFYFIQNIFINLLSKEFTGINITKKIKDYHKLTFIEFETELKKQKIELGLFKDKLKNQFETSKLKIVDILDIINKTENEINKLVYELYELTEEEIKIVEDS